MRFTLRRKLMLNAVIPALAFSALIGLRIYLTDHMEKQLTDIQGRYIPLIALGPKIQGDLEHLVRGFQDSVAAQDLESLKKVQSFRETLVKDLDGASDVIEPTELKKIHEGIENYYQLAFGVANRLISKETGTEIVSQMLQMQAKQNELSDLLKSATTLDQEKLINAFSTISNAQKASSQTLVIISLVCLVLMILISLALSRSLINSLTAFSSGLNRFGQGDFTKQIQVDSNDEFRDVAGVANQMAVRITGLIKELDSFSYSVAHDLRTPLRGILGFSTILVEDYGPTLPKEANESLQRIMNSVKRMGELIDSLLNLSRLSRKEIKKETVNLSKIVREVIDDLQLLDTKRKVAVQIQENVNVQGDPQLLRVVMANLLGNAWKFSSKQPGARVEFGVDVSKPNSPCFIRDNGAGFDMEHAKKLFGTFQRIHSQEEFEGTGIGLAIVQNVINRHGGTIWADSKPKQGATFYFTLEKA